MPTCPRCNSANIIMHECRTTHYSNGKLETGFYICKKCAYKFSTIDYVKATINNVEFSSIMKHCDSCPVSKTMCPILFEAQNLADTCDQIIPSTGNFLCAYHQQFCKGE